MTYDNAKLAKWHSEYTKALEAVWMDDDYSYARQRGMTAKDMAAKMLAAILSNGIKSVNIDGKGFKGAAKALGIKNTYKAWVEFLT